MSRGAIDCDVLVVGGGLVGLALANALSRIPVRTVLVEARGPSQATERGSDVRVTALANGSRRILDQLGLWPALEARACAIRHIHISERGRFGAAHIDAAEERVPALGYTVDNESLAATLRAGLEASSDFELMAPAKLAEFSSEPDHVRAEIEAPGRRMAVKARLLIAADGASSSVRDALGIGVRENDYEQRAIVVNARTAIPPDGHAFERFTGEGPIAVLPQSGDRVAVVWTLVPDRAEEVLALDEGAFLVALERAFGTWLGRFEHVGERGTYPLRRVRSDDVHRDRVLLIGSAAINLHPIAGQGFNLALRDVATIAELIADAWAGSKTPDPGDAALLAGYVDWRRRDQSNAAWFTHGLVKLFGSSLPGLGPARGLGLLAFDLLPGAKAALARHSMGVHGRLPRLARGLGLRLGTG